MEWAISNLCYAFNRCRFAWSRVFVCCRCSCPRLAQLMQQFFHLGRARRLVPLPSPDATHRHRGSRLVQCPPGAACSSVVARFLPILPFVFRVSAATTAELSEFGAILPCFCRLEENYRGRIVAELCVEAPTEALWLLFGTLGGGRARRARHLGTADILLTVG